jgi:hypothetical protein
MIDGEDLRRLVMEGQKYSVQDLQDLVKQLEHEATVPGNEDVVFFNGVEKTVKKATYGAQIKVLSEMQRMARLQMNLVSGEVEKKSWLTDWFTAKLSAYRLHRIWKRLCRTVFVDPSGLTVMDNLTLAEIAKVSRIFFQFQEELSRGVQGNLRKTSPATLSVKVITNSPKDMQENTTASSSRLPVMGTVGK